MPTSSPKLTRALLAGAFIAGSAIVPGGFAHAAGEYLTLSSYSGSAGSVIQVGGGNFAPNAAISIYSGTAAVNTVAATADASGNFGPIAYTVPIVGTGGLPINAVAGIETAGNSFYVQPLFPTLTLSTGSANPYSSFTASASGFLAYENVKVALAGTVIQVKADSQGALSDVSLTVPNVPAGTQTVTAAGQISGATATGYLYVNGFYPSVSPSSYYLLPGQTLSFNGSGFANGETVDVAQLDGTTATAAGSFVVASDGSFKAAGSVTIPYSLAGKFANYSLTGETSKAGAITGATVGQFFANVSPSAFYIMPGASESFSGTGFAAGETITVTSGTNSKVLGTITADITGSFKAAGALTIPFSAAGTTPTYHFAGSQSLTTTDVSVTVGQLFPQISPSGYYLMPGEPLTFSGSGFAPGETVAVTQGQDAAVLETLTADEMGVFTDAGTLTVPFNYAGTSPTYHFLGSLSLSKSDLQLTVGQLQPELSPSSYYLLPGSKFSATATGFAIGEKVDLTIGGTALETAKVGEMGNVDFTDLTFPTSTKASLDLVATGETSLATSTVSVSVGQYFPFASSSSYYAQPGTKVTISGGGFAPNDNVILTLGAADATVTDTTDEMGNLKPVTVSVPNATGPSNQVNIVISSIGASPVTVGLTLAPFMTQLSPSTYYATPGTSVTLSGSGFLPGEMVNLIQDKTALGNATADLKGAVSFTQILPFAATSATYTATGVTTATPSTVTIGLSAFNAGLTLSAYYAQGGSAETISGAGYVPGESVVVTWDGAAVSTITADTMGNFSLPTTVPYADGGNKKVVATGSTSMATASTTFTQATIYVSLQLGSYAGAPGTAVTFVGTGYMPGETVDITTDRITGIVAHFKADSSGSFTDSSYIVPVSFTPGTLGLTATGEHSLNAQSITYYVTGA